MTSVDRGIKSRLIAFAAVAIVLASIVTLAIMGFQAVRLIGASHESWGVFQQTAERKLVLISKLRGSLGYGGFIHNFKNMILRRDLSRLPLIERDLDNVFTVIEEYENLMLMSWEAEPVAAIRRTVNEYHRNFAKVKDLISRDTISLQEIDAIARVSDDDAIAALGKLDSLWLKESAVKRQALSEAVEGGIRLIRVSSFIIPVLVILGGLIVWLIVRLLGEVSLREKEVEERLRYETELEFERERLEQQAQELVGLAEDLSIAHDELEQVNDQKTKLFSVIAHDLRGPFTSLLGFSSILAQSTGNLTPEKVNKYANSIHRSGKRVLDLLNNLLDWARLQMDRVVFEPVDFELNGLVLDSVGLLTPLAEEKDITLVNEVADVSVHADTHMIDTVVRNLLNNALKFTDDGGRVTITAEHRDGAVELSVTDSGVGIAPERAATLFDMDTQSTTDGTKGEKGTGLGLLLCKELVERNGGTISVESTVGSGTTFRITLPPAVGSENAASG